VDRAAVNPVHGQRPCRSLRHRPLESTVSGHSHTSFGAVARGPGDRRLAGPGFGEALITAAPGSAAARMTRTVATDDVPCPAYNLKSYAAPPWIQSTEIVPVFPLATVFSGPWLIETRTSPSLPSPVLHVTVVEPGLSLAGTIRGAASIDGRVFGCGGVAGFGDAMRTTVVRARTIGGDPVV